MSKGTIARLIRILTDDEVGREPNNPRLDHWLKRTSTPLDLLALFTIWLTMVPFGDIHNLVGHPMIWYTMRIGISVVYLIDMTVRTALSHHRLKYVLNHPVSVVAVVIPALRLIFSVRLLTAMFRKGNLAHFLFVSLVLILNLTVMVYGFEHVAPNANIVTVGDAIWWAFVTLFTVGYGDFYPITPGGRTAAIAIMGIGLLTAAVITAQIASSFMDQAAARRSRIADGTDGSDQSAIEATIMSMFGQMQSSISGRLDSIEDHLHRSSDSDGNGSGFSGPSTASTDRED